MYALLAVGAGISATASIVLVVVGQVEVYLLAVSALVTGWMVTSWAEIARPDVTAFKFPAHFAAIVFAALILASRLPVGLGLQMLAFVAFAAIPSALLMQAYRREELRSSRNTEASSVREP